MADINETEWFKNFDFEKTIEEYKEKIVRPNILVCGASGVGKSSLINSIFGIDAAAVGDSGKPQTKYVTKYAVEGKDVVLYDSEGYEIGNEEENQRYLDDIIGYIKKKKKEAPGKLEEHIHEVWYCVGNNARFLDFDVKVIKEAKKNISNGEDDVPLMVIITKADTMTTEEIDSLRMAVNKSFPDISVFTFSTEIDEDNEDYPKYVQKEEITEWAISHLESSLRASLIPALKMDLASRRNQLLKKTIPLYTTLAAGSVVGIAAAGIPVADAAALMGVQTKMVLDIMRAYNIESELKNVIRGVVGSAAISYVGKTLATQLVGLVPGIGGAAKAAINTGVAATVTASLGAAVTLICEQYGNYCIKNNGIDLLPFSEFFTSDNIKKALDIVRKNKIIDVEAIAESSVSEAKQKKEQNKL